MGQNSPQSELPTTAYEKGTISNSHSTSAILINQSNVEIKPQSVLGIRKADKIRKYYNMRSQSKLGDSNKVD